MRRTPARLAGACALVISFAALWASPAASVPPSVSLHQLHWFIHEDLVTAQRPLATFWEPLIAQTNLDAETLLRGAQGPVDQPCCVGFEAASVSSFSDPSDVLLDIGSQSDFNQLGNIGGSTQARVFLVQSLSWCQGPGMPIGCADFPTCGLEPDGRKAVISLAAYEEFDSLGQVLAHEIGHTTCLGHVTNESCELMAASSGGGCLSNQECSDYAEDAQAAQGTCDCYSDTNTLVADRLVCSSVSDGSGGGGSGADGFCSGGICGAPPSDAVVSLFGAVDPSVPNGGTPNRGVAISGASGNWSEIGTFSANRDLQGLAYAASRGVLYGVAPDGGDDELLVIVDRRNGSTTTVATITGLASNTTVTGLAWDPGATSGPNDDRLFAVDLESNNTFGSLYAIDPDTAVATALSPFGITAGGPGGFSGLAYDPVNQLLYASVAFGDAMANNGRPTGLYRIETSCGSSCIATEVIDSALVGSTNKFDGGLAYDVNTHRFFHIGRQSGDRSEYDSYDAAALASNTITKIGTRGIDAVTVGGLAAIPEPSGWLSSIAALCAIVALQRRAGAQPATVP